MKPIELATKRLALSTPTSADVAAVTLACQDSLIIQWTVIPTPYLEAHAQDYIDIVVANGWEKGTAATWALRENGILMGMVGLEIAQARSADLGYWLCPEGRGRGLCSEAVAAVIDYAFDPNGLNLERLSWSAYVGNDASFAVAHRAGFQIHGPIRGHSLQRGTRRDTLLGTLYSNEWQSDASR